MTEKDFTDFAKLNGLPIARETMKPGNYLGRKLSSDLRIVAEVEQGKWIPIEDPSTKCIRYLAFANVENIKTGLPANVSVPVGFVEIADKAVFPFRVDDRGYTTVELTTLSPKQVEAWKEEEV